MFRNRSHEANKPRRTGKAIRRSLRRNDARAGVNPSARSRQWASACDSRFGRPAAAIVEFAVVLPLLLTILFGIIEYGWVFMVRQTLQNAAREGCRLMVLQTSVEPYTNVTERVAEVMQPTNVSGYSTSYAHSGCEETVRVSVPYSDVSLLGGFFGPHSYDLVGSTTMRKEGCTE